MNRPARGFEAPGNNHEVLVSKEKLIQRFLNALTVLRNRFETATAGYGRHTTTQPRFLGPFNLFRDFDPAKWSDPSALAGLNALFLTSFPDLSKLERRKEREAEDILRELASLWHGLYGALSSSTDVSVGVRSVVADEVAAVLSKTPEAEEEIPVLSAEEAYTLEVFLDALSGGDARLLLDDIHYQAFSPEDFSSKDLLKLIVSMIKGETFVPESVEPLLDECRHSYGPNKTYTPKSLEDYIAMVDEARDSLKDFVEASPSNINLP